MRWRRSSALPLVLAAVAVTLVGCGSATGGSGVPSSGVTSASPTSRATDPAPTALPIPSPMPSKGTMVTVTGIPEPGVEAGCLLLDGYLLTGGDRALMSSGRPVAITARTAPDLASFCQQGVLVVVEDVRAAS